MRKQEVIKVIAEIIVRHKIMIDKSYPEPCTAYWGAINGAKEVAERLNLDISKINELSNELSDEIYFNQK